MKNHISILRIVFSILAAVLASLLVLLALLYWAIVEEPPADGSDGYVRGVLGVVCMLPYISISLAVYHTIAVTLASLSPYKRTVLATLSGIVGFGIEVWIGAKSGPYDSVYEDILSQAFVALILTMLLCGSIAQYFICGWNRIHGKS